MNLTAQFERAIALTLEGFGDDAPPAATAFLTPSASCLWHGRRWRSFTLCASMRGAHWAVRPRRTRRLRPGSEGPRPGRSVGDECAECVSVVREVGGGPLVGEVLHLLQHRVDGLRGLVARHWPFTGHITVALERLALLPNPG